MTHEIPGKTRSTSRKVNAKHPASAVQRRQRRFQKVRAVAPGAQHDAGGAAVPKRKKPFVL